MREYKFRAWDGKSWTTLGMYHATENGNRIFGISQHEGIILMQFTGLLDKNNNEIYQGDIILLQEPSDNYPSKHIVVFNDEQLGFRLRWEGRKKDEGGFYDKKINPNQYKVFEIIGNIYSNPELLATS